jgi:predicted amidohydrolase
MHIALAQVSSGADPDENLRVMEAWTESASRRGADLVVFPEAMMRSFGNPLAPVAQPLDGPWVDRVAAIAKAHGVFVAAGMFTPADDGRVRNTLLVCGVDGVVAAYDKIHLFDAFGFHESETVDAGETLVVADLGGTSVGLATCYDVRFPALFTKLAERGADLVVVVASWGAGRGKVEQWQLLTRARALDATVYIAACGQALPDAPAVGTAPTGVGHSVVVSPLGEELGALGPGPGLLVVDVDLAAVAEARHAVPVLANARL